MNIMLGSLSRVFMPRQSTESTEKFAKNVYGQETVKEINCPGTVELHDTTVESRLKAGGLIETQDASVESIEGKDDAILITTTCQGEIRIEKSLFATECNLSSLVVKEDVTLSLSTVAHEISAGGFLNASGCQKLGRVNVGGTANLRDCLVESVTAPHVDLYDTIVQTDVVVSGQANVHNSTIRGNLTCRSNYQILNKTTIGSLHLLSSISLTSMVASRQTHKEKQKEQQILELIDCTIVGNVTFESGLGIVVLKGNSHILGTITGGQLSTL